MRSTLPRPRPFWFRPALLAAALACVSLPSQARVNWSIDLNLGLPMHGPIYHGPGPGYVTLPQGAIGVTVGGGRYWRHGRNWYRPVYGSWAGPRWVVVAPPVVLPIVTATPPAEAEAPALPAQPARPDPVIYPRDGQDAQQTEYDRRECNRWATTQPAALADAAVFHRAVEACMDGRGYTMK